jgi:hypothetical protein
VKRRREENRAAPAMVSGEDLTSDSGLDMRDPSDQKQGVRGLIELVGHGRHPSLVLVKSCLSHTQYSTRRVRGNPQIRSSIEPDYFQLQTRWTQHRVRGLDTHTEYRGGLHRIVPKLQRARTDITCGRFLTSTMLHRLFRHAF